MILRNGIYGGALLVLLSSCAMLDDLPDWMGSGKAKPPLPGTRIAILEEVSNLKPDESIKDTAVTIPEVKSNENWRQAGGGPQGMTGNLKLTGLSHHNDHHIGEGNDWDQPLNALPIVAHGMVFAMDAKGYITAHAVEDIDKVLYKSTVMVGKDEPDILGGGLAFDDDRLYATSGRGVIAAMDAKSGHELWHQALGVPLRAAPKVSAGKVYALSVDNQLFAFDAALGKQLWSHRGMNENVGYLATISPAVTDTLVIAPYSSGEIHALDSVSGQDTWSDILLHPRRNTATAQFSGIGGNPIIKDDVVYAASSSGFFAALSLTTGRRVWEQDITSLNTPWITDDFVYIISTKNELFCLLRADGRIKWSVVLPQFKNEEKRKYAYIWRGPVMAEGQLLIAGTHGQMLALSPKDGSTIATIDIPENITEAPIVAAGHIFMITQNAKLHVLY